MPIEYESSKAYDIRDCHVVEFTYNNGKKYHTGGLPLHIITQNHKNIWDIMANCSPPYKTKYIKSTNKLKLFDRWDQNQDYEAKDGTDISRLEIKLCIIYNLDERGK